MCESSILVVDDDAVCRRILTQAMRAEGFQVTLAGDGLEAWDLLKEDPCAFDALVLDRAMPRLDGMELLARLKGGSVFCPLPVIMLTVLDSPEAMREGLQAGAYHYVSKPVEPRLLVSMVRAAIRDHTAFRRLRMEQERLLMAMNLLEQGRFRFRTLEEAWGLAQLLGGACPQPERVVPGLNELLVNAIEHGNLGLGYDGKTGLCEAGQWRAEIQRRLELPENRGKYATLTCVRDGRELRFRVEDQGRGFRWEPFLDMDERRLFHDHGRGIAMARLACFDRLEYLGSGNIVEATVRLEPEGGARA